MSLTISQISQPTKIEPGSRFIHEFNPRISLAKSRFSPKFRVISTPSPVSSLRASATPDDKMTAPHHPHRGLPPPSAMTLPDPSRSGPSGPPTSLSQSLGSLPDPPPRQWQGPDDSMRNWLAAKAEEDKRKQEEEKTRQETLKLEQRKIEQSMLRDSLQGGVPPAMIPMMYAGMGGAQSMGYSMDWLQQYASQLQVTQQQIQQASPDMRRDGRLIGPPAPYSGPPGPQHQMLPSQHSAESQQQHGPGPIQTTFSAYQPSPGRPQNTSAPRSATLTQLPRLTTNEMYVHQPPPQPGAGSAHPLQQSQTIQQEQPAASPSIYFHHWVPPNEAKSNQQPQTPASKGEPGSSGQLGSHVKDGEYKDSPRKRKAQGDHQANPPPSAGPQYTSPSFSTTSSGSRRGVHERTRSNTSGTRETDSRPESSSNRLDHPPLRFHEKVDSGPGGNGNVYATEDPQKSAAGVTSHAQGGEETSRAPSASVERKPQEGHPEQPRPGSS